MTPLLKQLPPLFLIVFFIFLSCKNNPKDNNTQYEIVEKSSLVETEASQSCSCDENWFPHQQTPAPKEGPNSPFANSQTTNCIFHQWSWQKFLWVTKPQPTTKNPLFLDTFYQVSDAMKKITPKTGTTVSLIDTAQAGMDGILKTNPKYNSAKNTAYTVYYSIHINDKMFNAATSFAKQLNNETLLPTNHKVFPVGSLELKASWVAIEAIPNNKRANYFTTSATIGSSSTPVEVALLGMHVVGVVINHPEFIWATFEHHDLAPNFNWETGRASSTSEQLLFESGTTSGLKGISTDTLTHLALTPSKAYDLYYFGVPKVKGGAFMTNTAEDGAINYKNIKNINTCVSNQLNDVFKNYFYNGAIWINTDNLSKEEQAVKIVSLGDTIGSAKKGSYARGSLNNANVTMETFTQTFEPHVGAINIKNLTNCFSCHNAQSFSPGNPKSPLYVSHLFNAYLQAQKGKTKQEIDHMKKQQHIKQFLKKQQ